MNIIWVDENDRIIGHGTRREAIAKGFAVRVSRVFIANEEGALLIQKRSPSIPLPNRWDQSAAGHVDEGEDYQTAAYRELEEEMGISGVELKLVKKYYTEEHDEEAVKKRFNILYFGNYDGDINIDPEEVSEYRWIMPDTLGEEIKSQPDNFTEGFIEALKVYSANMS